MTYTESVIQAGGTPILISITTDSLVLTDIANRLDGIILIGGGDIHPSYFNESPIEQLGEVDSLRDVYDMDSSAWLPGVTFRCLASAGENS